MVMIDPDGKNWLNKYQGKKFDRKVSLIKRLLMYMKIRRNR